MFRNPDLSPTPCRPRLLSCAGPAAVLTLSFVLTGCGSLASQTTRAEQESAQKAALAAEEKAAAQVAASAVSPVPPPSLPPAPPPAPDAVARVLAYAERVRTMPPIELNQELGRLAAPGETNVPASQVQLSLLLSQLRQLPELIRAQELLARVLANGGADAQPLHPLARLLAFRYGEQRRLEDQLEKERQQTREVQRRLDQTNERLEALKAIERSLTTRPAPPASAPAPAPAPAAPPASRGRTAP